MAKAASAILALPGTGTGQPGHSKFVLDTQLLAFGEAGKRICKVKPFSGKGREENLLIVAGCQPDGSTAAAPKEVNIYPLMVSFIWNPNTHQVCLGFAMTHLCIFSPLKAFFNNMEGKGYEFKVSPSISNTGHLNNTGLL